MEVQQKFVLIAQVQVLFATKLVGVKAAMEQEYVGGG